MTIKLEHEVLQKLESLDHSIARLKVSMAYADGQAYDQDQQELRKLEEQRYEVLLQLKQYPQ